MRKTILFVVLAAAGCGGSTAAAPSSAPVAEAAGDDQFTLLHADDVEHDLASLNVYDANDRETYEQGHVPGARWVSSDAVDASALPEDRAARVVFYCANERCHASHQAANSVAALGYTNVAVMPEGIQGWVAAGKPTVAGPNPTAN